jgi:hypothetical protein
VAFHIERDAMIRLLPERLWGPRSGNVLPDDVLAILRALPKYHQPASAGEDQPLDAPPGVSEVA